MYIFFIFKILSFIILILLSVAFLTLLERKVLAASQRRKGPNVLGFMGFLQPFADALKLLLKETIIPFIANKFLFIISPIITFVLSFLGWAVIPFFNYSLIMDMNIGILYLFAISSLSVYGIVLAGWSSNSRYAFLGALRSAAQMISYEVSMGLILMTILLYVGSLNLRNIVLYQQDIWFIILFFPLGVCFFISILAETNRPPFDLPEAEAELVSGYNVEYSAVGFALFFIGEYSNVILMSSLFTVLFLGGWLPLPICSYIILGNVIYTNSIFVIFFVLKVLFILFLFIWIDYLKFNYRFFIFYNYLSLFYNFRINFYFFLNDILNLYELGLKQKNIIYSISNIFYNSNWLEREVWDMFGIYFYNHSDLRRILTDYGFLSFPLRKEFPLSGFLEIRYDDRLKNIVYENLNLIQEFRVFEFINPWY